MISYEDDTPPTGSTDDSADDSTTDPDEGGQVSEIGRLDPADADTPISDDQSVAGSPSDESGRPDEGPTGPNSRAGSDEN